MRKKVVCIRDDWEAIIGKSNGENRPKIGDEPTVTDEIPAVWPRCGTPVVGYILAEFPLPERKCWPADWFTDLYDEEAKDRIWNKIVEKLPELA